MKSPIILVFSLLTVLVATTNCGFAQSVVGQTYVTTVPDVEVYGVDSSKDVLDDTSFLVSKGAKYTVIDLVDDGDIIRFWRYPGTNRYKYLDLNGNGKVSYKDMKKLGLGINKCSRLIELLNALRIPLDYDTNGDGEINEEDVKTIFSKSIGWLSDEQKLKLDSWLTQFQNERPKLNQPPKRTKEDTDSLVKVLLLKPDVPAVLDFCSEASGKFKTPFEHDDSEKNDVGHGKLTTYIGTLTEGEKKLLVDAAVMSGQYNTNNDADLTANEIGYRNLERRINYLANGKHFIIRTKDRESKSTQYFPARWDFTWGAATIPIKIRFGTKNTVPFSFSSAINLGLFAGAKLQIGSRKKQGLNFLAGVSATSVATRAEDFKPSYSGVIPETAVALSLSLGTVYQIKSFQIGAFMGWDWIPYELGPYWHHQGCRPWLGIGIGVGLFAKDSNTESSNRDREQ